MPAVIHSSNQGFELAQLFGVAPTLIANAKKAGASLSHNLTSALSVFDHAGKVVMLVPMKVQALNAIKNKSMGPMTKQTYRVAIENALKQAITNWSLGGQPNLDGKAPAELMQEPSLVMMDVEGMDNDVDKESDMPTTSLFGQPLTPGQKAAATKAKNKLMFNQIKGGSASGSVSNASPSWQNVPKGSFQQNHAAPQKINGNAVPLASALMLYQPTIGTSANSVYWVLARFNGLNLAAKMEGKKLSLRVEGTQLSGLLPKITSLGFTQKASSDGPYASTHLIVDSDAMLDKAVGAVIGAIGFHNLLEAGTPQAIKS